MNEIAISVQNLGKLFRIGGKQKQYDTFAAKLFASITAPVRRLRRIGKPTPPEENLWALKGVSFDVRQGEILGIIGRNGAGKSTLLKLLSRITDPTEGRMEVHGRLGSLLEVGTGFHPELTGRENIYLNGAILGMKREEIRNNFDQIVAFAEIEKFLDTPVKRYSSGMYVRLAFAVAAHLEPEILVIDEVLAVGDAEFQKRCLGKMGEAAGHGRTILFVSHNMAAIKSLCTRAVLIEDGHVKIDGEVDKVVTTYLQKNSVQSDGVVPEDAVRINNGEGFLRRVRLSDSNGKSIKEVFLGQRFCLAMIYEITDLLEAAAVEVSISTLDGLRVATVCNLDEARPPLRLAPGLREITVEIDVTLLPGEYAVDVFLQNLSTNTTVDWVDRTLQFKSLNVAEVGEDHYHFTQLRGFVRPKSVWQADDPSW